MLTKWFTIVKTILLKFSNFNLEFMITDYGLIDTKLDTEQTQFMKDVVKFILGKETGLNTDMLFWTRIDTSHEGDNFSRDATYEEDYLDQMHFSVK